LNQSKEKFASIIQTLAEENDFNLIEAITSYSEENDIDMSELIPLLDRNLREQIKLEAIKHRYVLGIKLPKELPL